MAIIAFVTVIIQEIKDMLGVGSPMSIWVSEADFGSIDDNGGYAAMVNAFDNIINNAYTQMLTTWHADMNSLRYGNFSTTSTVSDSQERAAYNTQTFTHILTHPDEIFISDTRADDSYVFGNENTNAWGRAIDQYRELHSSEANISYNDVFSIGNGHNTMLSLVQQRESLDGRTYLFYDDDKAGTSWATSNGTARRFLKTPNGQSISDYNSYYPDGVTYWDYRLSTEPETVFDGDTPIPVAAYNSAGLSVWPVPDGDAAYFAIQDGYGDTYPNGMYKAFAYHLLTGNEPYFDADMSEAALEDITQNGAIADMAYLISAYNISSAELPITSSSSWFVRTFKSYQWDVTNRLDDVIIEDFASAVERLCNVFVSIYDHIVNIFGGDPNSFRFFSYNANLECYISCRRYVHSYGRYYGRGYKRQADYDTDIITKFFDHIGVNEEDIIKTFNSGTPASFPQGGTNDYDGDDTNEWFHTSEGDGSFIWLNMPLNEKYHYNVSVKSESSFGNAPTLMALSDLSYDDNGSIYSDRVEDKYNYKTASKKISNLTAAQFYGQYYFDIANDRKAAQYNNNAEPFVSYNSEGYVEHLYQFTEDGTGTHWQAHAPQVEFKDPTDRTIESGTGTTIEITDAGGSLKPFTFEVDGVNLIKKECSTNNHLPYGNEYPIPSNVDYYITPGRTYIGTSRANIDENTVHFITATVDYAVANPIYDTDAQGHIVSMHYDDPNIYTHNAVFMLVSDPNIDKPEVHITQGNSSFPYWRYNSEAENTPSSEWYTMNLLIYGYILIPASTATSPTGQESQGELHGKNRKDFFNQCNSSTADSSAVSNLSTSQISFIPSSQISKYNLAQDGTITTIPIDNMPTYNITQTGYKNYVNVTGGFTYTVRKAEQTGHEHYTYVNYDQTQMVSEAKTYRKYYMRAYSGPVNTNALISLLFYSGGYKGTSGSFEHYYKEDEEEFSTVEFMDEDGNKVIRHIVVKDYFSSAFTAAGYPNTDKLTNIWQAFNGVQLQPACAPITRRHYECGAYGTKDVCSGTEEDPYWSGERSGNPYTLVEWNTDSSGYTSTTHTISSVNGQHAVVEGCGASIMQEAVDENDANSEKYDQQSSERGVAAYVQTVYDANGDPIGYDYVSVEQKINENTDSTIHDIDAARSSGGDLQTLEFETYSFLADSSFPTFGGLSNEELADAIQLTSFLAEEYIFETNNISNVHLPAQDADGSKLKLWGLGIMDVQGAQAYDLLANYITRLDQDTSIDPGDVGSNASSQNTLTTMANMWRDYAPHLDQNDPFFLEDNRIHWTDDYVMFPNSTYGASDYSADSEGSRNRQEFVNAVTQLLAHDIGQQGQRAYIANRVYNTMKDVYTQAYEDNNLDVYLPGLIYLTLISLKEDPESGINATHTSTFFDFNHAGYLIFHWQRDGVVEPSADVSLITFKTRYEFLSSGYMDNDRIIDELCEHYGVDMDYDPFP